MAEMRQGLDAYMEMGAKVLQPYFLGLLAETCGERRYPEEGLSLLDEALAVMADTEARFYQAELYRLKGSLLWLTDPDASEVESCFQQALDIARHQQAKSWELRAATSLGRLWQSQGKRQAAYDLLAPVYGWFTEGFDTADLIDAKALLDELSEDR
jgi:predicted ATPase